MKIMTRQYSYPMTEEEVKFFTDVLQTAADDGFAPASAIQLIQQLQVKYFSFYAGQLAYIYHLIIEYVPEDCEDEALIRFLDSETVFAALQENASDYTDTSN